MQEREISLVDLILEILLQWRMIIVCMLVFGVLMGGYGYYRSYRTAVASNRQYLQEQEENELPQGEERALLTGQLEKKLAETQKAKVRSLLQSEKAFLYRKSYLGNSISMKLDANALPQTDILYGIIAKDDSEAGTIACAYEEFLNGSDIYARLAEQLDDRTERELSELIKTDAFSDSSMILDLRSRGQVIHIVIYEENKEACERLADALVRYVNGIDVSRTFGKYELVLLNRSYAEKMDVALMEKQIAQNDKLFVLGQQIAGVKDGLTTEEKLYYRLLAADSEMQEDNADVGEQDKAENTAPDTLTVPAKGSISIKYIVLGMAMGAFLYAGIIFLVYILSNKLRYTDDIPGLYKIPLLGQVPFESDSKKLFGFIDRWLRSLKNGGKRQFVREDAIRLAAVAVKMEASKEGINSVYCVGCELQQGADQVCNSIAETLKKNHIEVMSLSNILYDVEAREKLRDVKAVVLVEKAGVSMYQEISDELELLKRQKIAVLGSIVVE